MSIFCFFKKTYQLDINVLQVKRLWYDDHNQLNYHVPWRRKGRKRRKGKTTTKHDDQHEHEHEGLTVDTITLSYIDLLGTNTKLHRRTKVCSLPFNCASWCSISNQTTLFMTILLHRSIQCNKNKNKNFKRKLPHCMFPFW